MSGTVKRTVFAFSNDEFGIDEISEPRLRSDPKLIGIHVSEPLTYACSPVLSIAPHELAHPALSPIEK